jgi:SagB-type dehydrogenase family enzyme
VKRSACLVFDFETDHLYGRNYLTGVRVRLSPETLRVLAGMSTWSTSADLVRKLAPMQPAFVRRIVSALEACTFVVARGSRQADRERRMRPWMDWPLEARFYHFSTKRDHSVAPASDEREIVRRLLRRRPMPPRVKTYRGRPVVSLPGARTHASGKFPDVLLRRRTRRRFGAASVALADIATLLHLTWRFTSSLTWPGLGSVPLRTSPSGGARLPIDVYVAAARVDGIPSHLFYYRADRHHLVDLGGRVDGDEMARFCGHQKWAANAAALFLMTATIPRMTWRYRSSRAYRVMLLEAGHLCQTFCLAAAWLGLGSFSTAAVDDEYVERQLGIDGFRDTVVYAAGVGSLADRDVTASRERDE